MKAFEIILADTIKHLVRDKQEALLRIQHTLILNFFNSVRVRAYIRSLERVEMEQLKGLIFTITNTRTRRLINACFGYMLHYPLEHEISSEILLELEMFNIEKRRSMMMLRIPFKQPPS